MLQIKSVSKEYKTGDFIQKALNGVSLDFRNNEFVSILGASGSGKTTLLNIIGGLDSYDSGDLIINGTSTTDYTDSDWDFYRNHRIGFVFQSYNLIPHQNILQNVEIALTIGGISKSERTKTATDALAKVGLSDHLHKKPNQLSGGQMQRVAIARALVNNPDILLADEPTGALDTATSVQIMELLKEIAEDKLVIMVTHNAELAEQYSSRIVRLQDGTVKSDTDSFSAKDTGQATANTQKSKKTKMSMMTSLSLSFSNLMTKKKRTMLTSFAGSIGIIGIALIMSLSASVTSYITTLESDMMTSYPITISAETRTKNGGNNGFANVLGGGADVVTGDAVYSDYSKLEETVSLTIENNLTAFKEYLDTPDNALSPHLGASGVIYSYNESFEAFALDSDGDVVASDADAAELLGEESDGDGGGSSEMRDGPGEALGMVADSLSSSAANNFSQLLPGSGDNLVNETIMSSYDLLYGSWPQNYDEVVLFLDENNAIDIDTLYQLGFITADEYVDIATAIEDEEDVAQLIWDYEEVSKQNFYVTVSASRYVENENGTFDYLNNKYYQDNKDVLTENLKLNIVGVAKLNANSMNSLVPTTIGYTNALTNYIIEETIDSPVIFAQKETPEINVLTGMKFEPLSDEEKVEDAISYMGTLGVSTKASLYTMVVSLGQGIPNQSIQGLTESELAGLMDTWLSNSPDHETMLAFYDRGIGNTSYESNMNDFGNVDYSVPTSISIYTDSFENKDAIISAIDSYNQSASEENQITYVDTIEILTSSMTSMIDSVTYILIAFVAVSLVVSCIMIGIITHISVMERTKEIGVLRALGASKRNIFEVFSAETMIIGLVSGLIGVGITILANIPITLVVQNMMMSDALSVTLPPITGVALIAISVFITMFGGFIPAKSATKKDPVIALRTE